MFISGLNFGDTENSCYIPVFSSGLVIGVDYRQIFVGNLFMQHYYTVFDQSGLRSRYLI